LLRSRQALLSLALGSLFQGIKIPPTRPLRGILGEKGAFRPW
jgi:hypothetical protein